MLTFSSSTLAMGPVIDIQLPAAGHQMSLLRSLKSFETGENNASGSQLSAGCTDILRTCFNIFELLFYNAQKLGVVMAQKLLMLAERTVKSVRLKSPIVRSSFLTHHAIWGALFLKASETRFVWMKETGKLEKTMYILQILSNISLKIVKFGKGDGNKNASRPAVLEGKHRKIFFLLVYTALFALKTKQSNTELENKIWAERKEVYSKRFTCCSCGTWDTTWCWMAKFYERSVNAYISRSRCEENIFSKNRLFGSKKARKTVKNFRKYFVSSIDESS